MQRVSVSTTLRRAGFFAPRPGAHRHLPPPPTSTSLAEKEVLIERTLDEALRILSHAGRDRQPDVTEGLRFIHGHLFDLSLNAGSVYEAFPGSRFRLRFMKAFGMSVRDYIEQARLLVAVRLLSYPEIDQYLIADAVGYEHYGTFYRAFRRCLGCAPSTYRKTFQRRTSPEQDAPPRRKRHPKTARGDVQVNRHREGGGAA